MQFEARIRTSRSRLKSSSHAAITPKLSTSLLVEKDCSRRKSNERFSLGEVDVAVHSAKDLPSQTGRGAQIAAVLPRAPINDVLISKHSGGLDSLPNGATVATGSVRRQRQLHWKRADLKVVDLRGNVPTRLRKLAENEWDGIVLARAGLERLGFSPTRTEIGFEGGQFFLEILPLRNFCSRGWSGNHCSPNSC